MAEMTVKDLIRRLEAIENKDLVVRGYNNVNECRYTIWGVHQASERHKDEPRDVVYVEID